jgi:predicted enzyme related to lactoylglutathione lyase
VLSPMDFPGGRFAILSDPQGAVFGLHMLSRG